MPTMLLVALLSLAPIAAQAGSSCSVADNNGSCNITCPDGHAAICRSAAGGDAPHCYCQPPQAAPPGR